MVRVGQRPADLGEQLEPGDGERRLAALRLRGNAGDADDVPEVEIDRPGTILGDEQLDLPGAVDEVEEDELPHVAPSHDTSGDAPSLAGLLARLDLIGVDPNGRNLLPVGKSLGQCHSARV